MHTETILEDWPLTEQGQIAFIDTDDALRFAVLVWDNKLRCDHLRNQLDCLRHHYTYVKGQSGERRQELSDLAFFIQFTREALDETYNLQARARNFVRFK